MPLPLGYAALTYERTYSNFLFEIFVREHCRLLSRINFRHFILFLVNRKCWQNIIMQTAQCAHTHTQSNKSTITMSKAVDNENVHRERHPSPDRNILWKLIRSHFAINVQNEYKLLSPSIPNTDTRNTLSVGTACSMLMHFSFADTKINEYLNVWMFVVCFWHNDFHL